ncbi:hypothetical protein AB5J72_37200 [Streptomyces sp. CG1]|uniref:hypothetical protein n=1 Tax=Streptomyces sp. CG1 TaxID=1287523 RepID=UPI0034E1C8B3
MSDEDDRTCCTIVDATQPPKAAGPPPYATEHPESYQGFTLCTRCEWQEAQRTACSG